MDAIYGQDVVALCLHMHGYVECVCVEVMVWTS
jgi:hypothetical protein